MYVKVADTDFVRDTSSMGLSNTNLKEKNEYYLKVKMAKAQKEEINSLKQEIDGIRTDMDEIKGLLKQLIGKK